MKRLAAVALIALLYGCSGNADRAAEAEKNRQEGATYLAANAKAEGVVVRPSGLQYKVIREGAGPKPGATDTVTVHYRGTLINGKEFDNSYARKEPATFPLNGVIRGWTEGLQLMGVGGHYRFFIPSNLGYGKRGAGQDIGPDATLIFDVELLDVVKEEKGKP